MSQVEAATPGSRQRDLIIGSLIALLTVTIWGGWIVGTRYAVRGALLPHDIALMRFIVPAVVLSPYWLKTGLKPEAVAWPLIAFIVAGAGLPFYLAISTGLQLAPAAHAGMLLPGTMPLFVALIALLLLGEKFGWRRGTGYVLIALGGVGIGAYTIITGSIEGAWRGQILFVTGAFLWAVYTHAFRWSRLKSHEAVGIMSVWSLILLVPVWLAVGRTGIFAASWGEIVSQLLLQGVVSGLVALITYGMAVDRLGASGAAAFAALVPVLVTLLGIPVLGEIPDLATVLSAAFVCVGVFLASGVISRPR
ncbi:MAG: DMT family transporter [Alphaproteobacteria bacterium]|nr:DMT family transporter [Alphaproteobacteria bacterium]